MAHKLPKALRRSFQQSNRRIETRTDLKPGHHTKHGTVQRSKP